MTAINRDLIKDIRADIEKALEIVAAKHGLKAIKCGNATWNLDGTSGEIKLGLISHASAGSPKLDKARKMLDVYKPFHKDIDFDATYLHNQTKQPFTITGYNTRARTAPFILSNAAGEAKFKVGEKELLHFFTVQK